MRSRWPRALTRSTQKPLSELWKVTRSTRPARTSVELTVDICAILAIMDAELWGCQNPVPTLPDADVAGGDRCGLRSRRQSMPWYAKGETWEETLPEILWDRRELLKAMSVGTGIGFLAGGAPDAAAQQVKWSEGTEPPKLKAPPNACDCHHHIYDSRYPVDPKAVLRPGDALVDDYRAFQKRIGTGRNVVVQPSTYGVDNRVTLDAVATFGPQARAVVVVNDTVSDADLKRMHEQGARGIRFNLAQAGA